MNKSTDHKQTIAITGATGLLGRHLCDYFHARGWRVHALIRDTLKYPFNEKGIRVYKCDLPDNIDPNALESVNVLIHCAYMTRFTNIEEARRVNEEGTKKLYKVAKDARIKQFIFVSSRAARPEAQSYYAQSKYKLELMMDLSKDLIVRPGLILANDGGLFFRIVSLVKRLPFVPVFGGGQQKLNTIHVEDLCRVFEWALDKRICGTISAAESESITMKELLLTVQAQLGQNKFIISVPGKPVLLLLQLLESLKIKAPISSESLRGLLNREDMGIACSENLKQSGIRIRDVRENIIDLISK